MSVIWIAACLAGIAVVLFWLSEQIAVSKPEKYPTVVEHKKAVWK